MHRLMSNEHVHTEILPLNHPALYKKGFIEKVSNKDYSLQTLHTVYSELDFSVK